MSSKITYYLLFLSVAMTLAHARTLIAACPSLSTDDRQELEEYVAKKFTPGSNLSWHIIRESADQDCFRELQFKTISSSLLTLYLTPDLRHLSRELMDVNTDPEQEKRTAAAETINLLGRGDPPSLGPINARIAITVFSDFQCPFCRDAASMLEQHIIPETKDVKVMFRHFPLQIHSWALSSSKLAVCSSNYGNQVFWSVHDALFANQKEITSSGPSIVEQELFPERTRATIVNQCILSGDPDKVINRDKALGERLGVSATPTLFVNGVRIDGLPKIEQLRTIIGQVRAAAPK